MYAYCSFPSVFLLVRQEAVNKQDTLKTRTWEGTVKNWKMSHMKVGNLESKWKAFKWSECEENIVTNWKTNGASNVNLAQNWTNYEWWENVFRKDIQNSKTISSWSIKKYTISSLICSSWTYSRDKIALTS